MTRLELISPRGSAGAAAVSALASLAPGLRELDVCLPCGASDTLLGLAELGRPGHGRLRRLTLWVDGRTCVHRSRARQLQVGPPRRVTAWLGRRGTRRS